MNSIRWQKPKWLPRFLAMPVPEPAQQASRILAIQRNIILPARLVVVAMVFYYLFFSEVEINDLSLSGVVMENLRRYFIFYIIFNAIAATHAHVAAVSAPAGAVGGVYDGVGGWIVAGGADAGNRRI